MMPQLAKYAATTINFSQQATGVERRRGEGS
jgi:hypothetical protein